MTGAPFNPGLDPIAPERPETGPTAPPSMRRRGDTIFLALRATDRLSVATTIERLIDYLDSLEPDSDLEPYVAGYNGDDREGDEAEMVGCGSTMTHCPCGIDCEDDEDDRGIRQHLCVASGEQCRHRCTYRDAQGSARSGGDERGNVRPGQAGTEQPFRPQADAGLFSAARCKGDVFGLGNRGPRMSTRQTQFARDGTFGVEASRGSHFRSDPL